MSFRSIAMLVGLDKRSVRKFAKAPTLPEYAYRRGAARPRQLDPYKAYIVGCWQRGCYRGCHNATQIWREMIKQGYKGGRTSVKDFARELRIEYQHFDRQDNRDKRSYNQVASCPSQRGDGTHV